MGFTALDVKALREKTGCGMMDCKKALSETGGDMVKAADYLREKGLASAAKKAGRIAAEGVAFAKTSRDSSVGAVLEVNSETDFVAKNSEFLDFVEKCVDVVIDENPASVDELLRCTIYGTSTVGEVLTEKIAKIGENIKIRRFVRYSGFVVPYIHMGGRIAVLVNADLEGGGLENGVAVKDLLKDVAMQVAAINPAYLDKDSVPEDVLLKEKSILKEQVVSEGKPEAIAERVVKGKINKFYKENCLLEQPFVKNSDVTVKQYIEEKEKDLGVKIRILNFVRYERGEGIEKKESDFAAEVASMVG